MTSLRTQSCRHILLINTVPVVPPTVCQAPMRLRRSRPDPDTSALREKVAELKTSQWLQDRRLEDVHALIVLQPLLVGHPVLPLTGSALRPHCLTHLINDILINRRRRILEFGTGLSTILLAR